MGMTLRMTINLRGSMKQIFAAGLALFYAGWAAPYACGYAFNMIVPDVRQPAALSGGSACPVPSHQLSAANSIAFRWSTALASNPTTILTQNPAGDAQLAEVEQVIDESMAVWSHVSGTSLQPSTFAAVTRVSDANACATDGVNSICFDQADGAFTPGVLAFTRVITADSVGVQVGGGTPATEVGQILDADVYFDPDDSTIAYATPVALAGNPRAYDLESLLTHELGHALGFSHSAVWSAMMYPYAPAPGSFSGMRPTAEQPDASLEDDDRGGLRTLYPNASNALYSGSIRGRILPANMLSLPASPPGVTGVFGAHVVAVDTASGAVAGAVLGGWSCTGAGPAQFDGGYAINGLATGHAYTVYTEPLDGVVVPANVSNALAGLCRNATTDAGWPQQQACVVPNAVTSFTTRTRPSS
jgi:Matrixin